MINGVTFPHDVLLHVLWPRYGHPDPSSVRWSPRCVGQLIQFPTQGYAGWITAAAWGIRNKLAILCRPRALGGPTRHLPVDTLTGPYGIPATSSHSGGDSGRCWYQESARLQMARRGHGCGACAPWKRFGFFGKHWAKSANPHWCTSLVFFFYKEKCRSFWDCLPTSCDSCSSPLVPGCYLRDARSICCLFGVRVAPPSFHSFLGLAWWLVHRQLLAWRRGLVWRWASIPMDSHGLLL